MARPLRHIRVLVSGDPTDIEAVIRSLCDGMGAAIAPVDREEDRFALTFAGAEAVAPVPTADAHLVIVPWYNSCANWVEEWKRYWDSQAANGFPEAAIAQFPPVVYFLSRYEHYSVVRGALLFNAETTGVSQFRVEQGAIADTFKKGVQLS